MRRSVRSRWLWDKWAGLKTWFCGCVAVLSGGKNPAHQHCFSREGCSVPCHGWCSPPCHIPPGKGQQVQELLSPPESHLWNCWAGRKPSGGRVHGFYMRKGEGFSYEWDFHKQEALESFRGHVPQACCHPWRSRKGSAWCWQVLLALIPAQVGTYQSQEW